MTRRRPSCIPQSTWKVTHADCFGVLQSLDADTVDAIITDPPYGIGVNGMEWDRPARLDPAAPAGKPRRRPPDRGPPRPLPTLLARVEPRLPSRPEARRAPRRVRRAENSSPPDVRPRRSRLRNPRRSHVAPRPGIPRYARSARRTGHRPEARLGADHPRAQAARRDARSHPRRARYRGNENRRLPNRASARGRRQGRPRARPADHRQPARPLARQPPALTRRRLHRGGMRSGLPDRTARRSPPLLLRREGIAPRARRRLREPAAQGRADLQDRRPQREDVRREPRREHPSDRQANRPDALARQAPHAAGRPRARPVHRQRLTGAAAVLEGARFHGIEREAEYLPIARARIKHWSDSRRRGCASATARARQKAKA